VGAHAVQRELPLGPDQCFLLGDASFQSRDGRQWGPTALADLVGRPVAVVWPPSAWRRPR
jgi:type IV secretory pathway protease TraF